MKIIKIKLEYKCFPVWIYDENGKLLENDLPEYLIGDEDIDTKFVYIQDVFDSLYLDDDKEFKYVGFKEEAMRQNFIEEIALVINLLKEKLSEEYLVEENMGGLIKIIL